MWLYILATCCVMLATAHTVPRLQIKNERLPSLQWPDNYMVQLTTTDLVAGFMEDVKAWKTNSSSRVDFNKGVVKRITLLSRHNTSEGYTYEIYPETTKAKYNDIICHNISSTKANFMVKIDDTLPSVEPRCKFVGNEDILGINCTKFECIHKTKQFLIQRTIWALYEEQDDLSMGWTPIRYVAKKFNNKLGTLTDHLHLDYTEFSAGLYHVEDEMFQIDKFNCTNIVTLDSNHNSVTKNLMFINPEDPEHVDHVFESFKKNFRRQYSTDADIRRYHFQNSMRMVSSVNKKNLGYKLSINEFADRTSEEMQQHTGLLRRPQGKSGNIPFPYNETTLKAKVDELPEEYDMRLLGLISPVKNQMTCGSCWAFGTTAAAEGALAKVNGGRLMSLATQALIDCSWDSNSGCSGGSDNGAYEWMMEYGLPTEEEYGSYENNNGRCNIREMTKLYPIKGYTDVTRFSTSSLKIAVVNHGPVTVSVQATDGFKLYSSGIYNEPGCGSKLDHAVSLVGYGVKDGELFWILKNSWGPYWGIDGYMHISAQNNNCGVETEPTYVIF